ncbi:MAG: glycosyltransferase family 2 protein [Cytophagaceae bacterium]|nr:glycosyltransferase family 2 protein [Cytophagaceae bacterium]
MVLTSEPLVSIVTVNYNGVKVTSEFLDSIQHLTYPQVEVIVVDNASAENADVLKERYPWIILIKSPVNTGFAGGNNLGFQVAKGKYLLMLNNDTEVAPDFLEPLVKKMEEENTVGAVSSKVVFFNTDNILQYAGAGRIHPITGRGGFIGTNEKDVFQYPSAQTGHAHGAAMMVKREVIEKIGLMADLYFLYYEELDFCERIKNAGYSIWYIAESVVYHKESMTVGRENPLKTYYMTRNRILFLRRNKKPLMVMLFMLYFTFIAVPKNSLGYLVRGKLNLLVAFLKGYAWNFFNFNIKQNPQLSREHSA